MSGMESKYLKEQVANLFNAPDRVTFRELLQNTDTEYDELEFKGDYIEDSKLAKHILAMANTNGGLIVFGIEEKNNEFNQIGIDMKDVTDVKNSLSNFLPNNLDYDIHNFSYDDEPEWKKIRNKNFQIIVVEFTPHKIPFLPKKDGKNINETDIYCRKNSSSQKVNKEDLEKILNKRTNPVNSLNYVGLETDLKQLELLTSYLTFPKNLVYSSNPIFMDIIKTFIKKKNELICKKLRINHND